MGHTLTLRHFWPFLSVVWVFIHFPEWGKMNLMNVSLKCHYQQWPIARKESQIRIFLFLDFKENNLMFEKRKKLWTHQEFFQSRLFGVSITVHAAFLCKLHDQIREGPVGPRNSVFRVSDLFNDWNVIKQVKYYTKT